ncbi:MAG: hypothetical protein ABIH26_03215 [Candidatus Eisenbacteria bacterium]
MRIVLSIAGAGAKVEAARWTLAQLLEAEGLSVGEQPDGEAPFLHLAYGPEPARSPEGIPAVSIPALRSDLFEGATPEAPIEIAGRAGDVFLAFPPLVDLPPGEPLARDPHGRAAACRPAGRPHEVRFGFDLVAPAYFVLSRVEERGGPTDDLGRFPPESSWSVRRGLLGEPVADRLGRLLFAAIAEALRGARRATVRVHPWPEGRSFAIALTHDEDLVIRWERRLARHARQALAGGGGGRGAGARLLLRDLREGRIPPTIFSRRMADWESERGVRSTWFFLATPRDRFARRYRVDSPPFRKFLHLLIDRGFAVGLHGGLDSYLSAARLLEERNLVSASAGRPVAGVRQHYARLRVPETWDAQREAGLRYDASLGFPDAPGFRAGTSFPIRPEGAGDFLVFPLHGMDRALAAAGIRSGEAWNGWSAPARRAGGLLDILWHPHFVDTDLDPEREAAFLDLLSWIEGRKGEAWTATLDEMAEWWNARRLAAVSGVRAGERTVVRVRFGSAIRSARLRPVPPGSDIRLESAAGARVEVAAGPDGHLSIEEAAAGADIVLSLLPPGPREPR